MIDDQFNTSHLIPFSLPEIVLRTDFDIFWGPDSERMYHHIILYKKLFSDRCDPITNYDTTKIA